MYKLIKLEMIKSNPLNPRVTFEGAGFEDLKKSIREVGVLEPIIVRPVNGKFEIVAGERRFRALKQLVEKYRGLAEAIKPEAIPGLVRRLNDDEAFEIMIIENVMREGLTPLEEIKSFEVYVKQHGKEGVEELAQKTGIKPTYIRRRIAVLSLPQRALVAWGKGEISFGHLEELIRIKDKGFKKEVLDQMLQSWRHWTVKQLREYIDDIIPLLGKGKFNKEECLSCEENSFVQKKLWDIEPMKKTHCLNPKCFRKKQEAYFMDNWPNTLLAKQFKTTGVVFSADVKWDDWEAIGQPYKKCLTECKKFKTIIYLDGSVMQGKACVGGQDCLTKLKKATPQSGVKKEEKEDGAPRVQWHGQYFREEFFKERLPVKFLTIEPDDIKMLRTALFSMIHLDNDLYQSFSGDGYQPEDVLFKKIKKMTKLALLADIKELSLMTILSGSLDAEGRKLIAEHIGIALAKEWSPPEDFYQMKTKRELIEWGMKAGILKDKKATTFLTDTLKRKKIEACKKSELIRVFTESGIDLTGKVPDEVLGKVKK